MVGNCEYGSSNDKVDISNLYVLPDPIQNEVI